MKKNKEEKKKPVINEDAILYDELHSMIEDAEDNSSTWRDNTDTWHKLRIRHKKTKTFPFPGCSNLRLPTIEKYIRKAKSALIGVYTQVKPRMMIIPQDGNLEKGYRIEKFLDYLCDNKIMLLKKLIIAVDTMCEQGFSLAKTIWKMEDFTYTKEISITEDFSADEALALINPDIPNEALIEFAVKKFEVDTSETVMEDNLQAIEQAIKELREGKQNLKVILKDELYNGPEVIMTDGLHTGVPTDSGIDPQSLRMFYHEYFEPWNTVQAKAKNEVYDKDTVDEIEFVKESTLKDDKLINNTKDIREGIDRLNNPSKMLRVLDVYAYYDLDKDGFDEKCHFLLAPDFRKILKKQRLENDSQKIPVTRFDLEIIDNRWYSSRGIPEHLQDIAKEIDAQHNQKIDNQTIRNAPMFVYRSGIVNPRLVKFIPGQGIPVPGMTQLDDAIKLMDSQNPNVEFSYEREELLLKTDIQELLGQMDYSVQSVINKRQPRTLGEVQMQQQSANTVFSLDVSIFTAALTELFTQILELCQQYMPERVYALISGENGVEPIHLTRDEIQGKYTILVRGNDINSNPVLRAQKALARAQLLLSEVPLKMGIVTPFNAYNILKRYLQDDGELAWKELITQPQQQPPPPAPAVSIIKPDFDSLTDAEQAELLTQIGLKPDITGRALKSRAITEDKAADQGARKMDITAKFAKIISDNLKQKEKVNAEAA